MSIVARSRRVWHASAATHFVVLVLRPAVARTDDVANSIDAGGNSTAVCPLHLGYMATLPWECASCKPSVANTPT